MSHRARGFGSSLVLGRDPTRVVAHFAGCSIWDSILWKVVFTRWDCSSLSCREEVLRTRMDEERRKDILAVGHVSVPSLERDNDGMRLQPRIRLILSRGRLLDYPYGIG